MTSSSPAQNKVFIGELKQFILDNNIIGTTAGVCIALASKDTLLSLVADVIIPGITKLVLMMQLKFVNEIIPKGNSDFNITNFIKQFITWILMIILSFLFITYTLKWFIGNATKTGTAPLSKEGKLVTKENDATNTILNNVIETFHGGYY